MTPFDASGLDDLPRDVLRNLQSSVGDFVVVGKVAVDIVTRGKARLPPDRMTRDVDIAVAVPSRAVFDERVAALEDGHGARFRFRSSGTPVDVLPFGGLAHADQVVIDEDHLDVTGMQDAFRTATMTDLGHGLVVRVASLDALVVLKLVAWDVRGTRTSDKDARDLALLLRASSSGAFEDELWDDDEALEAMTFESHRVGPFRVGRAIALTFEPHVVDRVRALLQGDPLARLRHILSSSTAYSSEQLEALRAGLDDTAARSRRQ